MWVNQCTAAASENILNKQIFEELTFPLASGANAIQMGVTLFNRNSEFLKPKQAYASQAY